MLDDLEGRTTGERIQVLRERKGLTRPVLAGLVGMSASWLKGIERGSRLPPRLPMLVKLAEALDVGDVVVLAGSDLNLTNGTSIPLVSFARIPHAAVPAIRDAVRAPMIRAPDTHVDVEMLRGRVADAWALWHSSPTHRDDVGRILPTLVGDARTVARTTQGSARRHANGLLVDVYALVQHELVWASEPELVWVVADRAMTAAHEADDPLALAGGAWTLAMVERSIGDDDSAISLVEDAASLLRPRLENEDDRFRSMYGALLLHAATTCARAGREGDALRYLDEAGDVASHSPLDTTTHGPSSASPTSRCTRCRSAPTCPSPAPLVSRPSESTRTPSRAGNAERVSWWRSPAPTTRTATTPRLWHGCNAPTGSVTIPCTTPRAPARWYRPSSTGAAR
jgi:transcriptional regulator with XRE-family HTH domain